MLNRESPGLSRGECQGKPLSDDAGRPKLLLASHDYEVGIFHAIVQHHGADSGDTEALTNAGKLVQQLLHWG
ncbi:MAG: hypothetical protein AB7G11_11015 [Phycisphaerales bacterium]